MTLSNWLMRQTDWSLGEIQIQDPPRAHGLKLFMKLLCHSFPLPVIKCILYSCYALHSHCNYQSRPMPDLTKVTSVIYCIFSTTSTLWSNTRFPLSFLPVTSFITKYDMAYACEEQGHSQCHCFVLAFPPLPLFPCIINNGCSRFIFINSCLALCDSAVRNFLLTLGLGLDHMRLNSSSSYKFYL